MGTAAGQPPAPTPESRRSDGGGSFDMNRVVASMIGQAKGNSKAVIRHLVREGRRYRIRLKTAEEELAKRPAALKEGDVVLTGEEAKRWTALKDITLTPEQVKASLKKKDELETAETIRTQSELVVKSAKALGIKRPALLADQVKSKGMLAQEKEVEVVGDDGKRKKEMQVQVRLAADDKAPWRPIKEFVDQDLKDYAPALMAEEESSINDRAEQEEEAVTYPAQRGARGRAPVKDPVVKVIGGRYASPAELKKQSTS